MLSLNKKIVQLLSLVIFMAALWILHHELKAYHYRDIIVQIKQLSLSQLFSALMMTIFSYVTLTGYDVLGVRYTGRSLRYPQIALTSFISYAFSNNMANPVISGAIRYRLYSVLGLSAIEIARIITFCIFTFWLGFLTLCGVIFLGEPLLIPTSLHVPFTSVRPVGLLFLIVVSIYVVWTLLHKEQFTLGHWTFSLPSPSLAVLQILISCLDWILVSLLVYLLLPATAQLTYPKFLAIFLLAQILGLISQVPAGIGVFETLMVLFLGPLIPANAVLGSLLVYRLLYYLFPLIIALVLLALQEVRQRQTALKHAADLVGQWVSPIIPHVFALTTFIGGVILLFSGATPVEKSRLAWLQDVLPLPVIEISHFLGSIAGVGLILLARGLQRRLDGAYFLTVVLLGTGIVVSLLKGFDYEEALLLAIMLIALLPCHDQFYRKASLINQRFTPGWIFAIFLVLASSIWLGLFAYKHVSYSNELWWKFSLHGDAPRFLRASVGAIGIVFFVALSQLIRSAKPKSVQPTQNALEKIRSIVVQAPETYAYLALLGDKRFLFNPTDRAFIMYGIEGKSWITMGDPIGPEEEHAELVWRFRELCDRHNGWPVFYEVKQANLPLYIDQGLTLLKIGEKARVSLTNFSLEGSARRSQRHLLRKLEKEGGTFDVIPQEDVAHLLPELKRISDDWLMKKNTNEKRFSLGYFQPQYIAQTPVGIIRQNGKIVAFANLWPGGQKAELSLDLMRYSSEAPPSVMEYLFLQLMLWGKQQGYAWFSLGMVPLAGIENRAAAPWWNRITSLVYHHGEHFYNFQGLRQYKEKFDPIWEPRYLASPGGIALPHILANLTALNSGGLKGVISR